MSCLTRYVTKNKIELSTAQNGSFFFFSFFFHIPRTGQWRGENIERCITKLSGVIYLCINNKVRSEESTGKCYYSVN